MTRLHAYDDMVILVYNRSYKDFYYFFDLLDLHTDIVAGGAAHCFLPPSLLSYGTSNVSNLISPAVIKGGNIQQSPIC